MNIKHLLIAIVAAAGATSAFAADVYNIEPNHTYPSFEADHMGGVSVWRGKFTKTSGTITLDRAARTGALDITIDANSLDFGHEKMNKHAKSPDMFDVAQFPTVTYKASTIKFDGDKPAEVDGQLTLHGVTKPVKLTIRQFKCIQHPMLKKEYCGADAIASFNRSDFGISFGTQMGFNPEVKLAIQVEAIKQ
jgi:polyisoprenoid-binding protein YceI